MYTTVNDYGSDCIAAIKGCLTDPKYLDFPFETVLDIGTVLSGVMAACVQYIKTLTDVKYFNEQDFREYYLGFKGQKAFLEQEDSAINAIIKSLDADIPLSDPLPLYGKLTSVYKKVAFKQQIKSIISADEMGENPILWSDDYYNNLVMSVSSIEESSVNAEDYLIMGEKMEEFYDAVQTERETQEPVTFGWKILDDLIPEGPTKGHGGCIAGSTGMGKSALALNIWDHLIEKDVPTIYAPIEMGIENTIDRLVAHRIKVPYNELVKLKREERPDIAKMIELEMKRLKYHDRCAIIQDPVIDLKKLEMYIRRFQKNIGQQYCVVIIDLLTMITEFYSGESLPQAIEKAINALDILAKKLGIHYIGIVQLNRSIEQDKVLTVQSIEKLKPTRSSIKNSSAILERARYCLTIFRPAYFAKLYLTPEEAATVEDVAEVTLMKANNEDAGRIYLHYDGPTFTLTEMEGAH